MTTQDPPELSPEQKRLRARIDELLEQHRELDSMIKTLLLDQVPDEVRIKRLKKEKLHLKDEIAILEDLLLPDIIA